MTRHLRRDIFCILALALLLRLPFLNHPIQGDDLYYLYGAQHAQVEPLHPMRTHLVFQGELVDVEGHTHGPLNDWMLGGLLYLVGDIREVPFHAAYALFTLLAAFSTYALARRYLGTEEDSAKPLLATLLFMAVPAFVINGNSLETDVPFMAMWLATMVLWMRAIDKRSSLALLASVIFAGSAALEAYQSVLLVPLLAVYLWQQRRDGRSLWSTRFDKWAIAALFVVPLKIAGWQLFEWSTTGTLPAQVMMSYLARPTQQGSAVNKIGSVIALTGHMGWIMPSLLIVIAYANRSHKWRLVIAGLAAALAMFHSLNPLFWISIGLGVLFFLSTISLEFLGIWIGLFVIGSTLLFYAGGARYLLPMTAPAAILLARALPSRWLLIGFVLQLPLSLGLAGANAQHWKTVRAYAKNTATAAQAAHARVWVNGEMTLRFYLEAEGARPLETTTDLRAGDWVVTSELLGPITLTVPTARISELKVIPWIPLRIISLEGGSGYSTSRKGWLPFEISKAVVDDLHTDVVQERTVDLSYIDPKDPHALSQLVSGIYHDGWTLKEASVLLKVPAQATTVEAQIFILPTAPARHIELLVNGAVVGQTTFADTGIHTLSFPYHPTGATATVGLRVDQTLSVATDTRKLGVVVTGIGFK